MLFAIRRRRRANSSGKNRLQRGSRPRASSFASLVQKRQFDRIAAVLRGGGGGGGGDNMDVTAWLLDDEKHRRRLGVGGTATRTTTTPFQQAPPLHLALQRQPPVGLVRLLVERLHDDNDNAVDVMGRSPLHVAVIHNCELAVIEWLLEREMSSTSSLLPCDVWGRTPLHWAVLFGDKDGARPSATKRSRPPAQEEAPLLEYRAKVVAAITGAFPGTLHQRDHEGCTAWELAARHHDDKADGGALLHLLLGGRADNNTNVYREITVCNNNHNSSQRGDSSKKAKNASSGMHQHQQYGTTPDTSLMGSLADLSFADPDVPVEIVEITKRTSPTTLVDEDDDACSSLGTGGISTKYRRRAPRAASNRNRTNTANASNANNTKPNKPTATWLYERAKF